MAIRFIISRFVPLPGFALSYNPRIVIHAIMGNRVSMLYGRSISGVRREYFDPYPLGRMEDSRYDSAYDLDGRSDERILGDTLMLSMFNSYQVSYVTNDAHLTTPERSRWYIRDWRSFTLDDLRSDSFVERIGTLCRVSDSAYFIASTRNDLYEACESALTHNVGDRPAPIRDRMRKAFSDKIKRMQGATGAFGYVRPESQLIPTTYRGVAVRAIDLHTSYLRIRAVRKNLASLGRQLALGAADHPDYDCGELEDLLVDFANKLEVSTRNDIQHFINDRFPRSNEPDVTLCDCDHFENNNETQEVEGNMWCAQCVEDDAVWVVDREVYMHRDNAYYSDMQDEWYSYDYDEANREDDEDQDDDEPTGIMNYSTNVLNHLSSDASIKSSQFGDFLMGIEFEMCSGNASKSDAVDDVLSDLGNDYCIVKSDGSLPSDGFEIVTAPRGLTEHIEKFGAWEVNSQWRAWNTNACGLHVHIDSRAFSAMTLGKFLMFINSSANADFIRKLAGRHPLRDSQAQRYCAADGQDQLADPVKAVKGKGTDRYRMVNCANLRPSEAKRLGLSTPDYFEGRYNTIELRIFRASLKKERLLAQIEFAHASVMFCRSASYRDLSGQAFTKWLKTVDGVYPALAKWYGVSVARNKNRAAAPAEATCADSVTSEGD